MTRRPAVTQAEIARAVKGAIRAGLKVARIEVEGDRIIVITDDPKQPSTVTPLEEWRARRGVR